MTHPLSHRPTLDADIPLICQFADSQQSLFFFFPNAVFPLTPQQLQVNVKSRFGSTTVLFNGRVVGFGNLYNHPENGLCYLGNLLVDPSKRGEGIGRYLVQTLIDLGFNNPHVDTMHLCCFNENIRGLKLYFSLGFRPFSMEFMDRPGGGEAALIHFALPRPSF
ncbi:MAG: N-acetyltransferase [Magnetococcales bacterium]|nr:N-acetyltransferase [Magnetococcales bacterium]